jgi:hypothetical protein
MSTREYRVYHRNSESRVVAVTEVVANSRKAALRAAKEYAMVWNVKETRPNMVTKYIECEGAREDIRQNLFTARP